MKLVVLVFISIFLRLCIASIEVPQPSQIPEPDHSPEPQPSQIPEPYHSPEPEPSPQTPPLINEEWIELAISIIVIIIGIFWVFFGYKLFKIVLFMAGFVVFYFLLFEIMRTHVVEKGLLPSWANYVISAIAGIIGGFLFHLLKKIGIFLFGTLLGILLTTLLFGASPLGSIPLENLYQLLIIIGVGVISGILTLWLSRALLIVGTSFNGAFLIGNVIDSQWIKSGVSQLLVEILRDITKHINFDTGNLKAYGVLGGVLVLGIIGIIVQWKYTAGGEEQDSERNKIEMKEHSPLLTSENI